MRAGHLELKSAGEATVHASSSSPYSKCNFVGTGSMLKKSDFVWTPNISQFFHACLCFTLSEGMVNNLSSYKAGHV